MANFRVKLNKYPDFIFVRIEYSYSLKFSFISYKRHSTLRVVYNLAHSNILKSFGNIAALLLKRKIGQLIAFHTLIHISR